MNDEPRRRLAPLLGGLAGTAVLLGVVFSLGSWGYKYRRWLFHQGRLERILTLQPSAEQVRIGLEGEGAVLLGHATTTEELGRIAAQWAPSARDAVAAKGASAGAANVFSVGEMVYFVFFARDGKMVDFLVAERET